MTKRVLILLFGVLLAAPAWANDFADATPVNFARTLMRFGAIDVMDDTLLDEYAMVTDCDIFQHYYGNEFHWRNVRSIIRDSIKMNIDTFPARYHYDAELQFDRYDFKNRIFRFTDKTTMQGVNTFTFNFTKMSSSLSCDDHSPLYFPITYSVIVGTPVSMGGLPFSEEEAKALLQRLEDSGNTNRIVYTRFNMTIVHVEPYRKAGTFAGKPKYYQNGITFDRYVRLDARLDSVDFYEDQGRTKLIYSYTP